MWTGSSEDQDCGCPVHPAETFTPEDNQVLKNNNGQVCGEGQRRGGARGGA